MDAGITEKSWKYPGNIQDTINPDSPTPIKRRHNIYWCIRRNQVEVERSRKHQDLVKTTGVDMSASSDDKHPSRVLEHLYIGSRAHAKNRGLLKELGINRILNVTPPRT